MKAVSLFWWLIERRLSLGQVKIFSDLNPICCSFHFACVFWCVGESGATDRIIPVFPAPLNLITKAKSVDHHRLLGICAACVWVFL